MADPILAQSPALSFLMSLGRALLVTGTPAHRFEETMGQVAQKLGLEAQFFAIPTGLFIYIIQDGRPQSFLVRGRSDVMDLGRIAQLHELVADFLEDRLALPGALDGVAAILGAPPLHAKLHMTLANALLSACVTAFLNGGWREAILGALLGAGIGFLIAWSIPRPQFQRVLPVLGATLAGVGSLALCHLLGHTSALIVSLSALIVLIPSQSLVMATNELATDNHLAGGARSLHTLLDLGQLAIGLLLAQRIGLQWLAGGLTAAPLAFSGWVQMVAILLVAPSFIVLFSARWKDLPPVFVASVVAFWGSRMAGQWLGPEFGAGVAACLLGMGTTLWARRFNQSPFIPLLPAMVLLVPGVIGLQSFALLANRQVNVGLDNAFQMAQVAMAILVGLLLSRMLVAPRKAIRLPKP